jgi:hypothetical protein
MHFPRTPVLLSLLALTVSLTGLLAGCDRDRPDDLIDEGTYMDILLEMHLLAAIREMDGGDEERFRAGQDVVLSHYRITRDQFQRSHEWYHKDMHEQQLRYNTVRERLDELGNELSDRYMELRDTSVIAPYVP